MSEQEVDLPGQLGEVAVKGQWLLVPLNDGYWVVSTDCPWGRRPFPPAGHLAVAPCWAGARCFIAAGTDEFFDNRRQPGGDALALYKGNRGDVLYDPTRSKDRKDLPTVELPDRVVTAPLLPRQAQGPLRALVADARGVVTLLQGNTLEPGRTWDLGGAITAGSFLRGRHVGCIVEHTGLVWLDPDKDGKRWQYKTRGERLLTDRCRRTASW